MKRVGRGLTGSYVRSSGDDVATFGGTGKKKRPLKSPESAGMLHRQWKLESQRRSGTGPGCTPELGGY